MKHYLSIDIGDATAEKVKTARLAVWVQQCICSAGWDPNETLGLIKTAQKARE